LPALAADKLIEVTNRPNFVGFFIADFHSRDHEWSANGTEQASRRSGGFTHVHEEFFTHWREQPARKPPLAIVCKW
jgi:hypothetical protein